CEKLDAPRDERVDVDTLAPAAGLADELEQRARDLLAAVRLLLDGREVGAQIREVCTLELEIARAFEERLRAARDRGEWIVELVRDAGGEASGRRQALGEQHLALEPLRAGDVLDEHDEVRHRFAGRRQR